MRRLISLAGLLCGGLLLTACTPLTAWQPGSGASSSAPAPSSPPDSTQNGTEAGATSCAGLSLNRPPALASGQTVLLTADGFGEFVPVVLRLMGQTSVPDQTYQADGHGVVRIRYRVSPDLPAGKHLLAFTGAGPNNAGASTPGGSTSSSAPSSSESENSGGMSVVVTVPNLRLFHFVDAPDLAAPDC